MFVLFALIFIANAYDVSSLNEFSADVDIYDNGRMGRGKNAGSWHRSLDNKQEIFYYLAMQPWRHLVWTDCTGSTCYKYIINEDATNIPKNNAKLNYNDDANDYCRKEYAHPMVTYDIDWSQVVSGSRLDSEDINGMTCYKYPGKAPLAHVWLKEHHTNKDDAKSINLCRFDFIGGRSITFRSYGSFSSVFISSDAKNGYLQNKTKCNIDPTPNNVDTDIYVVLGISNPNVVQSVKENLKALDKYTGTTKQKKVYYLSGDSVMIDTVNKWEELKNKQVSPGTVDALINAASSELAQRVKSKQIERGTLVILLDRALMTTFDAATTFDRNGVTTHVVVYNPKKEQAVYQRALSLLSVGEQYYELLDASGAASVSNSLFVGIRANLTERCDRTKCNGFCDGRNRCTCPMCCENTCFFSYCDASSGTCVPWPKANPKKKIECTDDCVGTQECIDGVGCVVKQYNSGCEPIAKCMKPKCEKNKCVQVDTCEKDTKPSYNNKCWSYKCDQNSGNCVRDKSGDECPRLANLCYEHVCDDNLKCTAKQKQCVKTAPFNEMGCYVASCNIRTGMCETKLKCDLYSKCGEDTGNLDCKCAANFQDCTCTGKSGEGMCKNTQICDSTSGKPICTTSPCNQDLYIEGCRTKKCVESKDENGKLLKDEEGKQLYEIMWEEKDCTNNVIFEYRKKIEGQDVPTKREASGEKSPEKIAEEMCADKFERVCEDGVCYAQLKDGVSLKAGCGECSMELTNDKGDVKTYTITYTEKHVTLPLCSNGQLSLNYEKYIDRILAGAKCDGSKYVFSTELNSTEVVDYCSGCYPDVECNKATGYKSYTYNIDKATCSYRVIKSAPKCSLCNEDETGYISTCTGDNAKLTKKFQYKEGPEKNYIIPKKCYHDQCIPQPSFDCMVGTSANGISDILNLLDPCAMKLKITGTYHYSSLFNETKIKQGEKQSDEFMAEADDEAYCEWTVEEENCMYCNLDTNEKGELSYVLYDKCGVRTEELHDTIREEIKNNNYRRELLLQVKYYCVEEKDECELEEVILPPEEEESSDSNSESKEPPQVIKFADCPTLKCWERTPLDAENCDNTTYLCQDLKNKLSSLVNNYNPEDYHENQPELLCSAWEECEGNTTCLEKYDESNCQKAVEDYKNGVRDFGCRRPNLECNLTNLHCTFTEFTSYKDDIPRYTKDLIKNDLCYEYYCKEENINGVLTHEWVQTDESIKKVKADPISSCHLAKCNSTSGQVYNELKTCRVSDYFTTISEAQAQCFYCQCSFKTGDMVLTMYTDTESETYELDACGNCIVRNRQTGEQVNEPKECILSAAVNLTGAIAGATVAASVVFGLVGAMLIVSIGAFQTYQLVSSAMKNVISTTLENPEFVAAENEATNALHNDG